ncbi:transglycosylase domain-containing protein [Streptacidiphilus sp. 4-A2]|nr:transglycosylase domain-containing protein [Streptacidiphilus sp. 4-A2]
MYDANGGVIASVYSRDRTIVPLGQIAPIMRSALIDIEDHRFYQHGAIDLQGTLRALTTNAGAGTVSQGGSTLTQQYVKNVFVEEAGDDQAKVLEAQRQTTGRKIKELRYAIKMEESLTKDQILEDYLNITFFGEHAYGVEAAAERYFSVHAAQLTAPQAALLAGLVQSPSAYDPVSSPRLALQRRNRVLAAMAGYGTITRAQAVLYQATGLGLKESLPQEGCITARQGEAFFCSYVEHLILQDRSSGRPCPRGRSCGAGAACRSAPPWTRRASRRPTPRSASTPTPGTVPPPPSPWSSPAPAGSSPWPRAARTATAPTRPTSTTTPTGSWAAAAASPPAPPSRR